MLTSTSFSGLCLVSAIGLLLFVTGCGGSGPIIPHQTGHYSNASFSGSYVFQIHGFVSVNGNPYREVGVITADGAGHITGGVDDAASTNSGGVIANSSSITGSYSLANDGTGSIVLNSTGLGSMFGSGTITLAVTLVSTSKADLVEADNFADGAGTAELQDSTAIIAIPSGAFAFRLHQEVDAQTSGSASQVGAFNISGGSLSGNMDQNLMSSAGSLTLSGNLAAPAALGSGSGNIIDSSGFTTNFDYFIVNSGKFILLVSNAGAVGSGSVEAQTDGVGSGLAGSYVFGSRGDDPNFGAAGIGTVGQFTGSGATISSGTLDSVLDGNTYTRAQAFTGTPTTSTNNPSATGRVQVTLSTGAPVVFWMVSPSRAFFLFENASQTEDGSADQQTSTSFSASTFNGQFAMVMDGIDTQNPEAVARVGTLQFDGAGRLTLVEVVNDSASGVGAQNPGPLAGNYQAGTGGRITGSVSNNGGGLTLVMYAASGSEAYVLETDSGVQTSGMLELQH